jgi:hypothetical protein
MSDFDLESATFDPTFKARWSSWMFEVGDFNESRFTFAKGGFQGSRAYGPKSGGTFYLENVRYIMCLQFYFLQVYM